MNAPKPAYTPAPWGVESDGITLTMGNQAVVTGLAPDGATIEMKQANARLIAAAPRMYDIIETLSQRAFEVPKVRAEIDSIRAYVSGPLPPPKLQTERDLWSVVLYPSCLTHRGTEAAMRVIFEFHEHPSDQTVHLIDEHGSLIDTHDGPGVKPTTRRITVTDITGHADAPESMVGLIQSLMIIADAKPSQDGYNGARAAARYQKIARESLREIGVKP